MTARSNPYPAERCNIGPAEIERRRGLAIVLTAVSLALAVVLVAMGVSHIARIALWPFAAATVVTWLQVIRRFCVRFGALGVENFGTLGRTAPVDERARSADRRRALELVAQGAVFGLAATVTFVVLPI